MCKCKGLLCLPGVTCKRGEAAAESDTMHQSILCRPQRRCLPLSSSWHFLGLRRAFPSTLEEATSPWRRGSRSWRGGWTASRNRVNNLRKSLKFPEQFRVSSLSLADNGQEPEALGSVQFWRFLQLLPDPPGGQLLAGVRDGRDAKRPDRPCKRGTAVRMCSVQFIKKSLLLSRPLAYT